jgi:hypothetical protein
VRDLNFDAKMSKWLTHANITADEKTIALDGFIRHPSHVLISEQQSVSETIDNEIPLYFVRITDGVSVLFSCLCSH